MTKTLSKKPWEQDECVVHPIWNDGYQRYDLSIAEIIEKIKEIARGTVIRRNTNIASGGLP